MNKRQQIRLVASLACISWRGILDDIRRHDDLAKIAWRKCDRFDTRLHAIAGWPQCQCGCSCMDPATQTDDAGVPVCAECSDYAVDDEGNVHCARCEDVEIVWESCGAGRQARSYARIRRAKES